ASMASSLPGVGLVELQAVVDQTLHLLGAQAMAEAGHRSVALGDAAVEDAARALARQLRVGQVEIGVEVDVARIPLAVLAVAARAVLGIELLRRAVVRLAAAGQQAEAQKAGGDGSSDRHGTRSGGFSWRSTRRYS